jgi:hypothetical protein
MSRHDAVTNALVESVARLDTVLQPWGFKFEFGGVQHSHIGLYAVGCYQREWTRIHLSCRDQIDNLIYEQSFVKQSLSSREKETFSIGHGTLMKELGHRDDCQLLDADDYPDQIVARDGGDRVAALMHDLTYFAQPVLREVGEPFYRIVRTGFRVYSID